MASRVVIVGASIGGTRTAQSLRAEGFVGEIVLVGAEDELPYDKPPLSKQFLAGAWDADRVRLLGQDAAREHGIQLRLGAGATSLDLAARRLMLTDGAELDFDHLVIATGARARPSPWEARSGVHVLRTFADSRALRDALGAGGSLVVVGGGFIGAEVAATASALPALAPESVTVVDPLPAPAQRVVGGEIATRLNMVHERHGVSTRFGTGVAAVDGEAGALTVTLTDGERLSADTVLVGIGATPETGWLESSGLLIDDGVVCQADCRSVEDDAVHAVGDCARWRHPRHEETVRVEHWTNAAAQATCVAHNIAHPDDVRDHAPVEYVWSDQYDWKIQIAGRPDRHPVSDILGDPDGEQPRFLALFPDGAGGLGGAVAVNWPRALVSARGHIAHATGYAAVRAALAEIPLPGER